MGQDCDSIVKIIWTKFLQLKEEDKLQHLKKMVQDEEEFDDDDEEEEKQTRWSWRKLLDSVLCNNENKKPWDHKGVGKAPHSCNLYDRTPDFSNSHGWSVALDGSDYSPLKRSGVGIYHVNLSAVCKQTAYSFSGKKKIIRCFKYKIELCSLVNQNLA